MLKRILVFTLGLVITCTLHAQQADSIRYTKVFGGYRFERGNELLSLKMMGSIMKDNPEAYQYMKKANTLFGLNFALNYAGGFMIGWPIGTALGGGEPKWVLAAIGGGLILVSIPVGQSINKNLIKATDIYNQGLRPTSYRNNFNLKLAVTPNGMGVVMRF